MPKPKPGYLPACFWHTTGSSWKSTDLRVYRSLEAVPPDFGPCALTIGNFDGVHAGHLELIRRVVATANRNHWQAAAMTFDPHPARIIAPDRAPDRVSDRAQDRAADRAPCVMTTPEQRARVMREAGIQQLLIFPFTTETALFSPEYFVREVLVKTLQARTVIVGEDFRFGHRHLGDAALLQALGEECGFNTQFVPPVQFRGARVSSSRVRALVRQGRVGLACRLQKRPFAMEGPVVAGHGIGRTQTVPTLNLAPDVEILPANGVYVTRTTDLSSRQTDSSSCQTWKSVTNIGTRPTFSGDALTIETYLLGELTTTPSQIRVEFLARIRPERKFPSADALKQRILRDVQSAQRYFRSMEPHGIIDRR
jgi:riboflavin kinase/FMN adenylyltransferase